MPESLIKEAKIIIVDDERANVRLLEIVLQQAGYSNVFSTIHPEQVLPLCFDIRPDLLILDLHMPHFDGFEVMQILHADTDFKTVPILVLTADATLRARHRALAEGAKDFLLKPLDEKEALLRIRNLLEMRFRNEILENRVREAQRFMLSVFDSLLSMVVVLDQDGKIMTANRAWREYLLQQIGPLPAGPVGSNYVDLWETHSEGDRKLTWTITHGIRQVLDGATAEFQQEYPCHTYGTPRWYALRATPFLGDGPMRVVVTHEDITEYRYLMEELKRVRSEKEIAGPAANEGGNIDRAAMPG